MTPPTAPAPSVEAAKGTAEWARQRFTIHFERCRARYSYDWCQMCDDLDIIADHLESKARAAAGEGRRS